MLPTDDPLTPWNLTASVWGAWSVPIRSYRARRGPRGNAGPSPFSGFGLVQTRVDLFNREVPGE